MEHRHISLIATFPGAVLTFGVVLLVLTGIVSLQGQSERTRGAGQGNAMVAETTERTIQRLLMWLDARPNDVATLVSLANAYLQRGRETEDSSYTTKAQAALATALQAEPENPAALKGLEAVALSDHHFAEAKDWALRALAAQPDDPQAYGVLAGC